MTDRYIVSCGFLDLIFPGMERVIIDHEPDEFLGREEALKKLIELQECYRAELQGEVNSIIGEIAAARGVARQGMARRGLARPGRAWQGMAWQGKARFFNKEEREMKTIEIEITGTTPLLCHRFGDDAAAAATNGSRTSIQTGDHGTPREQAEKCLYLHDGKSIIPGPNLFRAIIEAGKFFKSGKSKITTQKSSLIPACISLEEIVVPIKHREPWTVDTRPVRIPATGGRILRHRPLFEDWQLKFSISVDTDMINEKLVREIIDAAGLRIGLGDFRPDCKGPYGKFKVTSWKKKK